MKSQRTQLQIPGIGVQAATREALKSHFRKEMAVCGIILAVAAVWMVILLMPGVRLW